MANNFFGSMGAGSAVSGARGDFATLPPAALPGLPRAVDPLQGAVPQGSAFSADTTDGPDYLETAMLVLPLAELLCHSRTQMPLTVALVGPAGSGKSFAMARLLDQAGALSAGAPGFASSPFLSPVFIAHADAAGLEGEAGTALGMALCQSLLKSGLAANQELARLALEIASDPHAAATSAQEKLAASHAQLEAENRGLAEARGRAAKLADSVLNESPGTALGEYVQKQRSTLEARLRGFGFSRGNLGANFRDLVRDLHESGGNSPGTSAFFRAMWAFRGQNKLLVWAFVFLLAGLGFSVLQSTRTVWMDWLGSLGPNFSQVTAWLVLHDRLPGDIKWAAFILAALFLLRNVVRAWRFTRPLVKGLRLLRADIGARREALEAAINRHSRRIASLQEESQRLERAAASANERAAAGDHPQGNHASALLAGAGLPAPGPAQSFLANLDAVMQAAPQAAPRRIIVAIDNLDGVAPARAAEIMEAAARVFHGPAYGLVLALDPKHVASAWSDSTARLEKLVQVMVQTGRNGLTPVQTSALVLSLLGHFTPAKAAAPLADASRSMLDRPMTVAEAKLLQELAPLAGRSARAVKRLVNLYRLARAPEPSRASVAALMLALDIGGTPAEITALRNGLAHTGPDTAFHIADGGPRLAAALQAVRAAQGAEATGATMLAGLAAASAYMRR